MKLCITITSKGEFYTANVFRDDDDLLEGKPAFWFFGDADVDVDGSPNWQRDPYGQAETSLHFEGKPVNSDIVPGIVLPPEVIKLTPEIVLGCFASVEYNGKHEPAVVFDVGPHNKLGELSACLAKRLGINDNPNTGGIDTQSVHYRFWPGVAAKIEGKQFVLTSFGSHHG
jgi:hypothetical protein